MPGANHPRQDYQTFPQASGSTPARTNRGRADLRVSLYSGAHFAGRQRRKNEAGSVRDSLGPAFTAGARLEIATSPYVTVGVFADYLHVQYALDAESMSDPTRGRAGVLGMGVWLSGRIPVVVGRTSLEFYVGVPVGLSAARPPKGSGLSTNYGLRFGAVGGAQAFVTDKLAVLLECGFRADTYALDDTSEIYARVGFLQAALRVGVAFAF
jgi:hypothetical protein